MTPMPILRPLDEPVSPELAMLYKLDARLARLESRVNAVVPPQRPLRVTEFAKLVGMSRYAIYTASGAARSPSAAGGYLRASLASSACERPPPQCPPSCSDTPHSATCR